MECKDCGKIKYVRFFATFRTRKGEIRRRSICWECRGKYAKENFDRLKEWRRNYNKGNRDNKKKRDNKLRTAAKFFVDQFKTEHPCADCGKS